MLAQHGRQCQGVRSASPSRRSSSTQPRRYVVSLTTNCGTIEIQLDVRQAPRTTASFAYLVKRGFYNDLTFHRVAADFVIQGGDPNGDGSGGPGYTIVEPPPSNMRYTLGTVAMAKTGTDPSGASGSQFFIVTAANASLPPQYALVGNVVGSFAGVEAISKLPTNPPQDGAPTTPGGHQPRNAVLELSLSARVCSATIAAQASDVVAAKLYLAEPLASAAAA